MLEAFSSSLLLSTLFSLIGLGSSLGSEKNTDTGWNGVGISLDRFTGEADPDADDDAVVEAEEEEEPNWAEEALSAFPIPKIRSVGLKESG